MKSTVLAHAMGALLICIGVSACTDQGTARQDAQVPYGAPEATTMPAQQPQGTAAQTGIDPYGSTAADPYATSPTTDQFGTDQFGTRTDGTDIRDAQTTGDTLGDRCAGLSGPALSDCLETERLRRQDTQDPSRLQDMDMPEN